MCGDGESGGDAGVSKLNGDGPSRQIGMLLWLWNSETDQWQAEQAPPGEPFPVGCQAILLPLGGDRWGLLARDEVVVNGVPALPLRLLADKDEILINREIIFFSAESGAEVVPFPAPEREVCCGRCKGKLQAGEFAAQCLRCKVWHHQTQELPCWTYGATCSSCDCSTKGGAWRPEPLRRRRAEKKSGV